MSKILFIATTAIHILNFHKPYIKWLQTKGIEVHIACKLNAEIDFADKLIDIQIERSPFNLKNINAIKSIKELVKTNNYIFIHGHTPMGGVLARISKIYTNKTKIIYTAHGFHFFMGSSITNWLTFFPIEYILSYFTDILITINEEDKNIVERYFPKKLKKFKINGIGVNKKRIGILPKVEREIFRKNLGVTDDIVILYIAEFTSGKNHKWIISQIQNLIKENKQLKFLFAGGGELKEEMEKHAIDLGVSANILFLGYREDIGNFMSIADIGISASKREGLPIGIAELSTIGLPVVVSNIRGHNELVQHGKNGFIFELKDSKNFRKYLLELSSNKILRDSFGIQGEKLLKKYQVENTLDQMKEIYSVYV